MAVSNLTLSLKKFNLLLKVGDGQNQIPLSPMRQHFSRIISKLDPKDTIASIELLEYQFLDHKYPYLFLVYLDDSLNSAKISVDQINAISQWIESKCGLNRRWRGEVCKSWELISSRRKEKSSIWQNKTSELEKRVKTVDYYAYLETLKEVIKESLLMHREECTKGVGCQTEISFENFIDHISQKCQTIDVITTKKDTAEKMRWLGTQKQLAELFIELEKNGWIDNRKTKAIMAAFTKSNTIDQYLKPFAEDGDPTYSKVFTKLYKPSFYGISENLKKDES